MTTIRLLLVDDQPIFRSGVRTLLGLEDDLEIVGEASNGAEALACAPLLDPDVILMDVEMPVLDGVQATAALQRSVPASKVLLFTTFDDDAYVFQGIQAGAVGYLLKDAEPEELLKAIRSAAQGASVLHPTVAAKLLAEYSRLASTSHPSPQPPQVVLSERELEILRLVAAGHNNREIGQALHLSESVVKNHVRAISVKLETRGRTQAAVTAKEIGLI